jgi:hypothetical protein
MPSTANREDRKEIIDDFMAQFLRLKIQLEETVLKIYL